MGMDLIPVSGNKQVHYNWSGWSWVIALFRSKGINYKFAGSNDGEVIPPSVCSAMADAIEENSKEYNESFAGEWYGPNPAADATLALRESGGMEQW